MQHMSTNIAQERECECSTCMGPAQLNAAINYLIVLESAASQDKASLLQRPVQVWLHLESNVSPVKSHIHIQ